MNKTALIIGRFQPFHKGHLNLIKRFYKCGYFLKIGIGSSQLSYTKKNPLTKEERKDCINLGLKEKKIKKYKIFYLPNISSDKDYVKHVMKIVGKFDLIVTGNPLVLKLFKGFNTKKNLWNIESFEENKRPGGEITATKIRKLWKKSPNRKGLEKSVYSYLNKIKFKERL